MTDVFEEASIVDKRVSIYGDSISTFEGHTVPGNRIYYDAAASARTGISDVQDTWWKMVADALGAQVLANASFSGSMVQGRAFPAAESEARCAQVVAADGSQPTDILVFMGINDYGWGSFEAQVAGRSEAAPKDEALLCEIPEGTAQAAPEEAAKTFGASYACMLQHLHEAAPSARIWCVNLIPGRLQGCESPTFCHALRGVDIGAYNAAIADATKRAGAELVDIASLGFDYESIDGTHPDKKGMRQLANMILAALPDDMSTVDMDPELLEGFESSRICDSESCFACPFAQDVSNTWSCICRKNVR